MTWGYHTNGLAEYYRRVQVNAGWVHLSVGAQEDDLDDNQDPCEEVCGAKTPGYFAKGRSFMTYRAP